jgi:hypothetical protein
MTIPKLTTTALLTDVVSSPNYTKAYSRLLQQIQLDILFYASKYPANTYGGMTATQRLDNYRFIFSSRLDKAVYAKNKMTRLKRLRALVKEYNNNLKRIERTYVYQYQTENKLEAYRLNNSISQVIIANDNDNDRRPDVCDEFIGKIYNKDDNFPLPPYHFNCVCYITEYAR